MIATLISAVAGGVVAVIVSIAGVAALSPSVAPEVPPSQMVKYGDSGHL